MSEGSAQTRTSLARPLAWYFGGLVAVYLIGLWAFWPGDGAPGDLLFLVLMAAPTAGALLARFAGGGRIRWGRLSWWILAGLVPAVVGLLAYLVGAVSGWVQFSPPVLAAALASSPVLIGTACISALGEEIGWRGFLWPTLRTRRGFWATSLIVLPIWWAYHVPIVLLGWYGSLAGLPAFTVAIAGFTLFVGVVTERSKGLWGSTLAHGAWNGLVATSFANAEVGSRTAAFTGDPAQLGEFGWLAAIGTLLLGLAAAFWHTRRVS
jgi:CAAX amino terminal protease family.